MMTRALGLVVALVAPAAVLGMGGCKRSSGTPASEVRAAWSAHGAELARGVAAVRSAVEAAPEPAVGAPCERAGSTPSGPESLAGTTTVDPVGNTEVVDVRQLLASEAERASALTSARTEGVVAGGLARMPLGPAMRARTWFEPG